MTLPPADAELIDLRRRLDELERENARLRAAPPEAPERPGRTRTGRWRAVLSALCIVLATALVPASLAAGWTRVQLVDEARFVETFSPLAADPAVQALIVDQVTAAIDENVDLGGLTDDLFDGIAALDLPPRAADALQLLRVPAAQGLRSVVDTAVTRLVQSDAFQSVWTTSLTASHRALVAAATGGRPDGALSIEDGRIGIQLAPIIEAVKQRLVDNGVGFASAIPVIDRTIVVAESDALATVAVVYNLAVTVGWWLPILSLALFGAGILLARRKGVAVLGTGIGLAIGGIVVAASLSIGATVTAMLAPSLGLPATALGAIYTQVVGAMHHTAVVLAVLGVLIAVLAWVQGRSRGAAAVRSATGSMNDTIRRALADRGLDTGAFGRWMYAQRGLVRVVLGVLVVAWLLALRPLSAGDLAMVLVLGLLVWWAAELVQSRPRTVSDPARDDSADPVEPVADVGAAV